MPAIGCSGRGFMHVPTWARNKLLLTYAQPLGYLGVRLERTRVVPRAQNRSGTCTGGHG